MARHKDAKWNLADPVTSWEEAHTAMLMDLRDELQALNCLLLCKNVTKGFSALSKIAAQSEHTFKRRVDDAARKRVARATRRSRG